LRYRPAKLRRPHKKASEKQVQALVHRNKTAQHLGWEKHQVITPKTKEETKQVNNTGIRGISKYVNHGTYPPPPSTTVRIAIQFKRKETLSYTPSKYQKHLRSIVSISQSIIILHLWFLQLSPFYRYHLLRVLLLLFSWCHCLQVQRCGLLSLCAASSVQGR